MSNFTPMPQGPGPPNPYAMKRPSAALGANSMGDRFAERNTFAKKSKVGFPIDNALHAIFHHGQPVGVPEMNIKVAPGKMTFVHKMSPFKAASNKKNNNGKQQ